MQTDSLGQSSAIELFFNWLFGNGQDKIYDENSEVVNDLRKSRKMNSLIQSAFDNYYDNELSFTKGTDVFTTEDGHDLHYAINKFRYTISIDRETRTRGFWFWKRKETRLVATVTVSDFYNFDESNNEKTIGTILNNIAFVYHNVFGGGEDYEFSAIYTVKTEWSKVQ